MRTLRKSKIKAIAEGRICGIATKTTGQPCRGTPMPNGRCYMHGGRNLPWLKRTPECRAAQLAGLEKGRATQRRLREQAAQCTSDTPDT